MSDKLWMGAIGALLAAQGASAQESQPNAQILAQMHDRCMATYAVRLTRTPAADEDIFTQATQSCQGLDARLRAAITAQFPPEQADEIFGALDAEARPNFMAVLARIRADRAAAGRK